MNLRFQLLSGFITVSLTNTLGMTLFNNLIGIDFPAARVLHNGEQSLSLTPLISSTPVVSLPKAQHWLDHLQDQLLPFWRLPTALGDPIGSFPSVRCNDGSLLNFNHPCPEIKDHSWLMKHHQYVVSLSRQTYVYGVAFHLTGDPQYLEYAQAGVNYLRQNALDRQRGGAYSFWDGEHQSWQPAPEYRNAQEQAYALLGLSYYYYLTRDPEVLPDILAMKEFIFKNYYNSDLDLLQWQLQDGNGGQALGKQLTAQLDQLNAYMVLLTPILPEPYQTEWKQDMVKLAKNLINHFYSLQDNLFFLSANLPKDQDIQQTGVDFGHTIKAMWMIRMVGLLCDEPSLVSFANENGSKVLERAYLSDSGSWGSRVQPGGEIDVDKNYWIYSELDQFTASIALEKPSLVSYLAQTYHYWFNHFVDQQHGEVWNGVNGLTNEPINDLPKQWSWKNGYHSFEHALVGYITSSQLHGESVVLYYAFKQQPSRTTIHPYFYQGQINDMTTITHRENETIYRVNFTDIR